METMLRTLNRWQSQPMLKKFSMGLMMGIALGWVLWQRRRPESQEGAGEAVGLAPGEIDITEPRIEVEESEPPAAAPLQAAVEARVDDLTQIRGIGPVFARRLNEAGIVTFAGLAAQPAARLAEIVAAKSWQAIDPQAWIDQAAALAGS